MHFYQRLCVKSDRTNYYIFVCQLMGYFLPTTKEIHRLSFVDNLIFS